MEHRFEAAPHFYLFIYFIKRLCLLYQKLAYVSGYGNRIKIDSPPTFVYNGGDKVAIIA
jgi:hypothetical protein